MSDPADRNLAPEQFPALNRQFFSAEPPAYFRARLSALMLMAGRPDLHDQAFREGVKVGYIEVKSTDEDEETPDRHLHDYTITEAVVLLHHASEALLRLFFALEHFPECPWLEAARLRGPRAFKDRVDQLISAHDDPDQVERISRWLLGKTAKTMAVETGPDGQTGEALQGTIDCLVLTARRLLSEGNLYNAAKHGLAVLPGQRGVSLGKDELPIDLSVQGPSLTFLERVAPNAGQPARWNESTTWVQLDRWIAWTELVLMQMRSLWAIGKLAYQDEPARVHPVFPKAIQAVTHTGKTYNIDNMRMQLAYYVEDARSPGHD